MISRHLFKNKKSLSILIVMLFGLSCLYIYGKGMDDEAAGPSGQRCLSELSSVKYQLRVVTEFKEKADKLLEATQKLRDADKESFKDIVESCVAMKQHTNICQNQFEDLQIECTKLKETNAMLLQEIEDLKAKQR